MLIVKPRFASGMVFRAKIPVKISLPPLFCLTERPFILIVIVALSKGLTPPAAFGVSPLKDGAFGKEVWLYKMPKPPSWREVASRKR